MQELSNSIQKPNLRLMGIGKGTSQTDMSYIQKNKIKFPKPQERFAHSGIGSLQNVKQTS
jgi:hypothetical protein